MSRCGKEESRAMSPAGNALLVVYVGGDHRVAKDRRKMVIQQGSGIQHGNKTRTERTHSGT